MRTLVYSPDAVSAITDIWQYTVATWGECQADRYNRMIEAAVVSIASGALSGTSANAVRSGYRQLPVGKHTIYFQISDTEVMIMHVLHQKMDVVEEL